MIGNIYVLNKNGEIQVYPENTLNRKKPKTELGVYMCFLRPPSLKSTTGPDLAVTL